MLMALLFVGGLMNMFWIAGLALLVLVEKLLPFGRRVSQITGSALIGWGRVRARRLTFGPILLPFMVRLW